MKFPTKLKSTFLNLLIISVIVLIFPTTLFAQLDNALRISINPSENPSEKKPQLSYEIKPTKSVEDILTIRNNSNTQTYILKVYAVDSIQSNDGTAAFKLFGTTQRHIGNWVKFNQETITLAPSQTIYLPYKIDIPEKVAPGTYQGGLILEMKNEQESKTSIKIVGRLVEPIYISVPGRKNISYDLEEFSYQQINGKPSFNLKVSNQGNVFLKTNLSLNINGTLLPNYETNLNQATILQGEKLEKSFTLDNPPLFGDYQATLEMKIYEYDVTNNKLRYLQTINKTIKFSIIPYACLLAVFVIIILIILAERWRRKNLQEKIKNTFTHTVKKGENIESIAKLYKAKWEIIAELNQLQSPYVLAIGRKLLLPFPKIKSTKKKLRART